MKCKITPEHKVRNKPYRIEAKISEAEETILYCKCLDCPASKGEFFIIQDLCKVLLSICFNFSGGCKDSVAFILWLHRRSEEPSVTSVECYWKVSKLSKVGSTTKFITLGDLASKNVPTLPDIVPDRFLGKVLEEGKKYGCQGSLFLQKFNDDMVSKTSIHKLILLYKNNSSDLSAEGFIEFIEQNVNEGDCKSVQDVTINQYKSSTWYEVRYGRITASKLYEASKCTTFAGSLVEEILGGGKIIETPAMARGIFLSKHYPIYGASPDGLTDTHVVEVKCPLKEKTVSHYISADGKICNKPYAQIQLQMLMTGRTKGYFCVASPDFETTGSFQVMEVNYDPVFMTEILKEAECFWRSVIFTHLIK